MTGATGVRCSGLVVQQHIFDDTTAHADLVGGEVWALRLGGISLVGEPLDLDNLLLRARTALADVVQGGES